jgi:hypothetical protein
MRSLADSGPTGNPVAFRPKAAAGSSGGDQLGSACAEGRVNTADGDLGWVIRIPAPCRISRGSRRVMRAVALPQPRRLVKAREKIRCWIKRAGAGRSPSALLGRQAPRWDPLGLELMQAPGDALLEIRAVASCIDTQGSDPGGESRKP